MADNVVMSDQFERVFTVTDYYDGPLEGIADFRGTPHAFLRMFDHKQDEYSNVYQLKPINAETLRLALEQWDIWLRWQAGFHRGEVGLNSHPALPTERERYKELAAILVPALEVPQDTAMRAVGRFRPRQEGPDEWVTEVSWEPIGE